jgi:hypothetical protein
MRRHRAPGDGNVGEGRNKGGTEMAKQEGHLRHAFAGRSRTLGALTMVGGTLLTTGAILVGLGWYVGLPAPASVGNALSVFSGFGLLCLSFGLRARRLGDCGVITIVGTGSLVIGMCLVSIVDLPAILGPTNLEVGGALGPVGLLLL